LHPSHLNIRAVISSRQVVRRGGGAIPALTQEQKALVPTIADR
jgi:hypothetical protein